MNKYILLVLIILLGLTLDISSLPVSAQTGNAPSSLTGVYDSVFTTDQGLSYPLRLTIVDLKNGQAELSCDFKGYPINLTGEVSGQAEDEGALCRFVLNKPGLVNGQIEFTVQKQTDKFQLQGRGWGTYSYLGKSGQINGILTGSRNIASSTPAPAPVPVSKSGWDSRWLLTAALLAGLLTIGLYITRKSRRRS